MSKPAIPQDQSPLFATLPLEMRRNVYQQLWLDCGLTQHISAITGGSCLLSYPCILSAEELNQDPGRPPHHNDAGDAPDDNAQTEQPQPQDDPGDIDGALLELSSNDPGVANDSEPPNNHPWCGHFACFRNKTQKWGHSFSRMYSACYRRYRGQTDLRTSPILTAFLVCKRMYQEASESLFSEMRFSFSTMLAMDVFLCEVPRALVSRVQFIDIIIGYTSMHPLGMEPVSSRAIAQDIYDKLRASFPKLQELRLSMHPRRSGSTIPQRHDLEPLYTLAREAKSLRRFEVFLPTKCGHGSEVGYGETPTSLQDAPFTVKVVAPGWHEEDGPHFCSPW